MANASKPKKNSPKAGKRAPTATSKGRGRLVLGLGLGAALLALGALGAAWVLQGGGTDATPRAQAQASTETSVDPDEIEIETGTGIGQRAPDFVLADLDGNPLRLEDLLGRPTILYFSAAWCTSCIPQTRELAKLKAEYGDRVHVVWIDVNPGRDTAEDLREYLDKYGHEGFLAAFDTLTGEVARRYRVRALGQTYLLDARGIVVQSGVGLVFSEGFRRALQDLALRASTEG